MEIKIKEKIVEKLKEEKKERKEIKPEIKEIKIDELEKTKIMKPKRNLIIIRFRHWLVKKYPKIVIWIFNKHKGECRKCGSCCYIMGQVCPYLKNSLCSVNINKPLSCRLAPLPFDLWFDKRFKNCGIYYFKKPKRKNPKGE